MNTPVSPAPAVNTPKAVPADDKMAEADALAAIRRGVANGDSVRTLAEATGWSVGWVTARRREEQQSGSVPGQTELEGVAA